MGRPKKPTALKELHGTARKDRANPREPKLPVSMPKAPNYLDTVGNAAFADVSQLLYNMQVLTDADGMALALLSDAVSEYISARKFVLENGPTYTVASTAGDKLVKSYPQVAMASDAWKRIKGMLTEYGLTAASRAKVDSAIEKDKDALAEFLAWDSL